MSTNVQWPPIAGSTYSIPASGELNWQALSSFLIAVGTYAQSTQNTKLAIRVATTSPVSVATASDTVIVTDLAVPGAVGVSLPAGVLGQCFFIVDGKGDAATNNITITPFAGLINGAATYVINKARAGVLLGYNGTGWTVLSEFTNVAAGAIPRSSIAAGSANHVVINDGSGLLSSEAQLAGTRGGTGVSSTATYPASGVIPTTSNKLSVFAATTSAELAGVISDETGTGALVFANSPALVTPTGLVKGDVGLGNVDNTSDATKNAAAVTLTNKTLTAPVINSPTGIVKADVGLGNVDNTSDATKNAAAVTLTNKTLNAPILDSSVVTTAQTLNAQAEMRFADADSSNYVGFKSGATVATNKIWTLPTADGSSGQVLSTDGSATLSWATGLTSVLNQYNAYIGNSSNVSTPTNTNLLGESLAQTRAQTATMTIAAPGVVTSNGHGMALGDKFYFTTTGALPTGVSASTTYYASAIAANTFNISTTFSNAIAGTYVTTTGSQSGTHTLNMGGITGVLPSNAANATRMGLMCYSHGVNYNGGNAPTITLASGGGTLSGVGIGDFWPYQTADGNWKMIFTIAVTLSSVSRTSASLAIAGLVFFGGATQYQAVSVATGNTTTGPSAVCRGDNTNQIEVDHTSSTTTQYNLSGNVKLASKPTWAY